MTRKVLLVGESWVSAATHYKGFDQFGSVTFHLGAEPLVKALKGSDFDLTYMPAHEAVEQFPFEMAGLDAYSILFRIATLSASPHNGRVSPQTRP